MAAVAATAATAAAVATAAGAGDLASVIALGLGDYNQSKYGPLADQAATANGIPTDIFRSLVGKESNYNPYAVSSAGAIGLTQLMPATAARLGVNPYDPAANLNGGASYLKSLFDQFGNWADALSAYNAGPGNVSSAAGQSYASSVLAGTSGDPAAPQGPSIGAMKKSADAFGTVTPGGALDQARSWLHTWGLNGLLILCAIIIVIVGAYIAATRGS
jgi:hypothetical protein